MQRTCRNVSPTKATDLSFMILRV